jgi:hypothetical protein
VLAQQYTNENAISFIFSIKIAFSICYLQRQSEDWLQKKAVEKPEKGYSTANGGGLGTVMTKAVEK